MMNPMPILLAAALGRNSRFGLPARPEIYHLAPQPEMRSESVTCLQFCASNTSHFSVPFVTSSALPSALKSRCPQKIESYFHQKRGDNNVRSRHRRRVQTGGG